MIFFSLIKESISALLSNKLRTFLTVLGMMMGVASVITIVSTVEGMQQSMEDTFNTMGQNTLTVTRFGIVTSMNDYLERLKRKKLTRELIPKIEEGCPDCEMVGAEGYAYSHIKVGAERLRWVQVSGETPNNLDMRDLDVAQGRYLSWEDDRRRRKVAFIGHVVYEKFFEGEDPINRKIKLGREEFTVIGVAEKIGGLFGSDFDEFVTIPLSTHQKIYHQPGNPVNLIIKVKSAAVRENAIDQVRVVLRSTRRVPFDAEDDFEILTPDAILGFINDITKGFRVLLMALPLLSIVVGGIVIMNIMMISVTERTREIGIRKAIGASRKNILYQFLFESIIVSVMGGAIGVIFGVYFGSLILTSYMDIFITPTAMGIILGVGISTAVGLFFGIYPAMKASKLDPIEALSFE